MIKLKKTTEKQRETKELCEKYISTSLNDVYDTLKKKFDTELFDVYASRAESVYCNFSNKNIATHYFICRKDEIFNSIKDDVNCIGLHEIITEEDPTKIYIDYENLENDYLDVVIRELKTKFGEECIFNITNSSRPYEEKYKYSYHITIENRHLDNYAQRQAFKKYLEITEVALSDGEKKKLTEIGCDKNVYSKRQLMRMVNNCKYEKIATTNSHYKPRKINDSLKRIMPNSNQDEQAHLIKYIHKGSINVFGYIQNIEKIGKIIYDTENITKYFKNITDKSASKEINRHTCNFELFEEYEKDICKIFFDEELGDVRFKYWDWYLSKKMREYYYINNKTFDDYWKLRLLKCIYKKQDQNEKYKKHMNEWNILQKQQKDEILKDNCIDVIVGKINLFINNFNGNMINAIYKNNLLITPTKDIKKLELDYTDFSSCKISYVPMPMGTRKTLSVVDYIYNRNVKSCIVITSMTNLLSNFISADTKKIFKHYKEIENNENPNFLVCCINSLCNFDLREYECIIFDEIELLFNNHMIKDLVKGKPSMYSKKQTKDVIGDTINRIKDLLKMTKKVFCLDAILSNTTIDWVNKLTDVYEKDDGTNHNSYEIINTSVKRPSMEITKITYTGRCGRGEKKYNYACNKAHSTIIERLKKGKRIFVYTPYINTTSGSSDISRKTQSEIINLYIENGCDFLRPYIKKCECGLRTTPKCEECIKQVKNEKFTLHNSKSNKDKLKDVNTHWGKDNVLTVVNSSVCAGSSYTNDDFPYDDIFIFHNPSTALPRIIAQVMKRIRKPKGKIYLIYASGYERSTFEVYDFMKQPDIFNHFYNVYLQNIASHKYENLEYTLRLSNFTIKTLEIDDNNEKINMNDEIENEKGEILKKEKEYKNITNIHMYLFENIILDENDTETIDERTELNNIDLSIKYDKIFFCKLFKKNVNIVNKSENIAYLYNDENFKKMTHYLLRNNSLDTFNQILPYITFKNGKIAYDYKNINNFEIDMFFKALYYSKELTTVINGKDGEKHTDIDYYISNAKFLSNEEINIIKKQLIRTNKTRSIKSSFVLCEYLNIKTNAPIFRYNKKTKAYKWEFNVKLFFELITETLTELEKLNEEHKQDKHEENLTYAFINEETE